MQAIDQMFEVSLPSSHCLYLYPPFISAFPLDITSCHPLRLLTGLPPEGLLHGESGPPAAHHRGLLEDDLGVEKLLHCHAHRAGGEGAGVCLCGCVQLQTLVLNISSITV